MKVTPPSLDQIRATAAKIAPYVRRTPVWQWQNRELHAHISPDTAVFLKLELFQHTGTFKPRGAINNLLALTPAQRARGVTAVSAGNHAIAVAYAAQQMGVPARVVMLAKASPVRVAACRAYGAEVVLIEDVHEAFAVAQRLETEEGLTFVHPFEGEQTCLGTATVGLELGEAVPDLDAVVVPVGGGGLIAGISTAIKQLNPHCLVFGVEPEGAPSMYRSFQSGQPERIDRVRSIADSLGAPYALPYSFALTRQHTEEIVLVRDEQIRRAMGLLFYGMKLAVEPAGAAATAALMGPLRERLAGKRVGIIVCGANIDLKTFHAQALEP